VGGKVKGEEGRITNRLQFMGKKEMGKEGGKHGYVSFSLPLDLRMGGEKGVEGREKRDRGFSLLLFSSFMIRDREGKD